MQVVLCSIFLASVGLAQWVVHDRTTNGGIRLEKPEYIGSVGICRPAGWLLQQQSLDPVLYVAQEPGTLLKKGRTLIIQVTRVSPDLSPMALLERTGEVFDDPPFVPINIGNCEGILVSKRSQADTEMYPGAGPVQDTLIAACVCPNGKGVLLILKCPDEAPEDSEANVQLIHDIARKIQVQVQPGK
jgi:hypothetical protein